MCPKTRKIGLEVCDMLVASKVSEGESPAGAFFGGKQWFILWKGSTYTIIKSKIAATSGGGEMKISRWVLICVSTIILATVSYADLVPMGQKLGEKSGPSYNANYLTWLYNFGLDYELEPETYEKNSFNEITLVSGDLATAYDSSTLATTRLQYLFHLSDDQTVLATNYLYLTAFFAAVEYGNGRDQDPSVAEDVINALGPMVNAVQNCIGENIDLLMKGYMVPFYESSAGTYYMSYGTSLLITVL